VAFSGGIVDGVGDGAEGLVAAEVDVGIDEVGQFASCAAHIGKGERGLVAQ
jgi:hypothetical protein